MLAVSTYWTQAPQGLLEGTDQCRFHGARPLLDSKDTVLSQAWR
jgi:hypothetical protein